MVPFFDGPFKHHNPDEPEKDREHAGTHTVTSITDYLREHVRHINSDSRPDLRAVLILVASRLQVGCK